MTTIKLMTGTNERVGKDLLNRKFNDLSFWSDNLETVAHYFEGSAIQITIKLNTKQEMEYVRGLDEPDFNILNYTYGKAEVICPKDAIWYSFSKKYLEENVINIEEIFPDMSEFNEEE